jgi:hypothetical protein
MARPCVLTPAEMKRIAIDEISARLDRLEGYEAQCVRSARLLDFVFNYRHLLPSHPEFERLMLEHAKWVDRERNAGRLPAAASIPRRVARPKLRKSLIVDQTDFTGNAKGKRK